MPDIPTPNYTWDHIHLRSPDPEATAAWFERMLGAQVIRSTVEGKPRIDLKLGGADVFIMPVAPGDPVNPAPVTPYQGLDHFGLQVSGIDAVAAELRAKGAEFTMDVPDHPAGPAHLLPARPAGHLDRTSGARREVRLTPRPGFRRRGNGSDAFAPPGALATRFDAAVKAVLTRRLPPSLNFA